MSNNNDANKLDDRMTEETKTFVSARLKIFNPSDYVKTPLEILRNGGHDELLRVNQSLKFENLESVREIFIKNLVDNFSIPVTIFAPTDAKKDAPIVVYYHGGGWIRGSREASYHACASMASKSRTIWVSVEYRLAPEYKFKTQLTDYIASFEFIEKNRELFSSKEAKIGVSGDSAGGQIAALLTHKFKSIIDFQILIYPFVDLATHYKSADEFAAECYFLVPSMMHFMIDNYLEDIEMAKTAKVSPIFEEDFTKMPKCLIVAAELDPLVDQSKAYYAKYIQGNNQVDLKIVPGVIHGHFTNGVYSKLAFEETQNHILKFLENI